MSKKNKKIVIEPIKLNLSEVKHNLTEFPWPYKDGTVEEIQCLHLFGKIPGELRPAVMDEAYRVLKPGGTMVILSHYYTSMWAFADSDYKFPPISEANFMQFDKIWREKNNSHPEQKCNFTFNYGYIYDPELQTRTPEVQADAAKHKLNSIMAVQINLTKV